MTVELANLVLLSMCVILLGISTIMLWKKFQILSTNNVKAIRSEEPQSRINDSIENLTRLVNIQSSLLSIVAKNMKSENHCIEHNSSNQPTQSPAQTSANEISEQKTILDSNNHQDDRQHEQKHSAKQDISFLPAEETPEKISKELERLLNSSDFTRTIWQQFSRPFDICAKQMNQFLGDHGIPSPRIEAFPPLEKGNPNFWSFMIVEPNSWKSNGKRFLIPRNYDRYDILTHSHLFEVQGNRHKADSSIIELVRCATLSSGSITNHIDKKMVETKGIIAVD